VTATFGEVSKEDPTNGLRRGYIGTALDHTTKTYVVVVDPAVADVAAVQRTMGTAATRAHAQAKSARYGFRLDAHDPRYVVTFSREDQDVADALVEMLGDLVKIQYGTPSLRRFEDPEPHWGGAAIGLTPIVHTCTSAFTVVRVDTLARGSVTAGHCFEPSQNVYSGPQYYGART
jgi:hypothetical protein